MDKVSVIVPIYKVEKYLNQCIESIVNQTYKNLEIILIDDGSPDNCPQMCDEWAKKDERIKVIHKANGGLMAAWIDGVKGSSGDYICFVDSDDYVHFNFVEKLYNGINGVNADICVCNYIEVYDTKEVEKSQSDRNVVLSKGENIENCVFSYNNWDGITIAPCRWNKMFKRKLVLDSIKYLNTEISMGEDMNMTFYAMSKAKKVSLIPDFLYYYRQLSTSISKTKRNNWVHYKKLLKQLLIINEEEGLNIKEYIYSIYVASYIIECVRYVSKYCDRRQILEFLHDDDLQYFVSTMKKTTLKRKLFYWALKHKMVLLTKWAGKII